MKLAVLRYISLSICLASRYRPNITMSHCKTINLDKEREHQRDISAYATNELRNFGWLWNTFEPRDNIQVSWGGPLRCG
jgi:hypothetical protein